MKLSLQSFSNQYSTPQQQLQDESIQSRDQGYGQQSFKFSLIPQNLKRNSENDIKPPTIGSSGDFDIKEKVQYTIKIEESKDMVGDSSERRQFDSDRNYDVSNNQSLVMRDKEQSVLDSQLKRSVIINLNLIQQKSQDVKTSSHPNDLMKQFFRLLVVKRMAGNFKYNLMQRAYVLSKENLIQKAKYFQEEYTKDRKIEGNRKSKKMPLNKINTKILQLIGVKQKRTELKITVFEPGNKVLLAWELLWILFTLIMFWWAPFKISFRVKAIDTFEDINSYFLIFVFIDILVKLNKGFVSQGLVVLQRSKILLNYYRHELISDVGTLVSLILLFITDSYHTLLLILYMSLNLVKLKQGLGKIQEYFYFKSSLNDTLDLVKLVLVIFYVAHMIACVWHFVGLYCVDQGIKSWITEYNLLNTSILTQYNYSFYWATMTMVTVGYGDITPQNDLEMFSANLTMFVACGVFAFSVNSIGIVLQNINDSKMKLKRSVSLMNNYMNNNSVGFELQSRVRNYLQYCFQEEEEANDDAVQDAVDKLSKQLKEELLFSVLSKVLKQNKVIWFNFSDDTKRKVACLMEPLRFCPDDKIIEQNQIDDQALFIIQKGEVYLIEEQSKKILGVLRKGDSFGEASFFSGQQRVCSAVSKGFTKLYKVKRELFLEEIQKNKLDLQKFHEIKDKFIFSKKQELFQVKCFCCESAHHMVTMCPQLIYQPDIEKIVKKEMFPCVQERSGKARRIFLDRRNRQTFTNFKTFQMQTLKYQEQHDDQLSSPNIDGEDSFDPEDSANHEPTLVKSSPRNQSPIQQDSENKNKEQPNLLNPSQINPDVNNNQNLLKPYIRKSLIFQSSSISSMEISEDSKNQNIMERKAISQKGPGSKQQSKTITFNNIINNETPPIDEQKHKTFSQKQNTISNQKKIGRSQSKTQFTPESQNLRNSGVSLFEMKHPHSHKQKPQNSQKSIIINSNQEIFGGGKSNKQNLNQFDRQQSTYNNNTIVSRKNNQVIHIENMTTENASPFLQREINELDNLEYVQINLDIDIQMNFANYFPEFNVELVCKRYLKMQKNQKKAIPSQQEDNILSKYTFYYQTKKRVAKLLRYLKIKQNGGDATLNEQKKRRKLREISVQKRIGASFKNHLQLIQNEKNF